MASTTTSSKASALAETERLVKRLTSSAEEDVLPGIQHLIIDGSGSNHHLVCSGILDKGGKGGDASGDVAGDVVDPSTLFMAYSCTKIITSIAILQLCQNGQLKLEDSLTKHFPSHPYTTGSGEENDKDDNMLTIGTLLNHTSGIPNPIPIDWFFVCGEAEDDDSSTIEERRNQAFQTTLTKHNQLQFLPGTKRLYGNLSYWILEKVIETVSGVSYQEYIQQHILDPLEIPPQEATFDLPTTGCLATGHIPKWSIINGIFYLLARNKRSKQYWIEPSSVKAKGGKVWSRFDTLQHWGLGYGGLYCTATALGRILHDLMFKKESSVLLNEKMKQYMFQPVVLGAGGGGATTPNTTTTTTTTTMGGWVMGQITISSSSSENNDNVEAATTTTTTIQEVPYFGKQGGGYGFHGNVRIYPSIGIATVFLANSTEVSEHPIDTRSNFLDQPIVQYYNNNNNNKEEEEKEGEEQEE